MRKIRIGLIPAFFLGVFFPLAATQEQEVKTEKVGSYYVTEGWMDSTLWHAEGLKAIRDFAHYRDWMLKGMDGKDPESAKFWGIFVDFIFDPPDVMTLIYDVNIIWPFGSKGNKMRFKVDATEKDENSYRFFMLDKGFGIEDLQLFLRAEPDNKAGKRIRFRLSAKFSGFIELLLNFEGYSKHMNWRVWRVSENLKEYGLTGAPLNHLVQTAEATASPEP